MDPIVLKTEVQSNGEILLFYVDENGDGEEGVLTTVENIEHQALQLEHGNFVIEDVSNLSSEVNLSQSSTITDLWNDEDIRQLLVFYIDNKETFISGTTKRQHLWTVACRTMLVGKTPDLCETKLDFLKQKYIEIMQRVQNGVYVQWEHFELCHQAFGDDADLYITEDLKPVLKELNDVTSQDIDAINVVQKNEPKNSKMDDKVETMLKLYLKYKKQFQQAHWTKDLWESIALELGQDSGEYWQKRFLNYKQHYLRLLDKIRISSTESVNWPYMDLFNKIFEGDQNFSKKYLNENISVNENSTTDDNFYDWDNTEMTVLVKYCFDCFDEFQDRTIPNKFLWGEIGRLLDKNAEDCKQKYDELKNSHLDKYLEGGYEINVRKPIEILFDSIISKEIELQFSDFSSNKMESWSPDDLDSLVQFFHDNTELYKQPLSHFVCWAVVAKKLGKNVIPCRSRWEDLVSDYKSILNAKKEDPDLQIEWRYIDLFDRIFDYGMDTKLLSGYEAVKSQDVQSGSKIGVKKVNILEDTAVISDDDDEYIDEKGIRRRNKTRPGESKAIRILEYYLKNKDKFSTSNRNKHALWQILAQQINISATQCAHRFRNLKQVYTAYVKREINKPDIPILWPYYALCKKVFGYRAIKNKLKNGKLDSDEGDHEWSTKEIKQLINYFSHNFDSISSNEDDNTQWSNLSKENGKTEVACKEKFMELRKSYRKLKTMRSKKPGVKIMWKYFDMFKDIYSMREGDGFGQEPMDIDDKLYMEVPMGSDDNRLEEDDYQCIIVIPEGQDISQIENARILIQGNNKDEAFFNNTEISRKWTKKMKKKLLINYINYIRLNKGKEIDSKVMWAHIGTKLNKTAVSCKRMFVKMKTAHKQIDASDINAKTPYHKLMEKVMRLKPKYIKNEQNTALKNSKTYKDVILPDNKVEEALKYYLDNLESFLNPRFEKKYLWTELANNVGESVTKVFNKINYLKQTFNNQETIEELGERKFADFIQQIQEKEAIIKQNAQNEVVPVIDENIETTWTDDEIELLLQWYLSNLDKFKNPKFVRSYLWLEVSNILNKSAISCSKKMSEIRTQYRNMVRSTNEELEGWRFLDLCLKIYGTGKKNE